MDDNHDGWRAPGQHSFHQALESLTPRLRETLDGLLQGKTEEEIALERCLSSRTIHHQVEALYKHFGVESIRQLLAKSIPK